MKTAAAPKATKGRAGRRPGPFWRDHAERWVARLGGRQYTAPASIGQANVKGAREWYEAKARELGIEIDRPATELPSVVARAFTLSRQAFEELKELDKLVTAEQLRVTGNRSVALAVAIHEALVKRKMKPKDI